MDSKDAKEGGHGVHRSELCDPIPRFLQAGVGGRMRCDDQLGSLFLHPRVLLYEARDADPFFREHLTERREHTSAVVDPNAVIRARLDLANRDHSDAIVEAERGPALDPAANGPGEIHEVADDSGPGGPSTR